MENFEDIALSTAVFLPLVGALLLMVVPRENEGAQKLIALLTTLATMGVGIYLLAEFDYDLNLEPSFPVLDPTKPHRAYWYLKKYGLPFMYWNLMLKGLA